MRRYTSILLWSLLVSSVQAEVSITLQGQLGGESRTVDLSPDGTLAYLGVGPRLVVLDLSEPGQVRELGKSRVLPEIVEHVVVAGDYAFVAAGMAGLYVLDVSNPADPAIVGRYEPPAGDLRLRGIRGFRVCVSGRYVYFCDGQGGLHVLDASRPAEPLCVASLDDVQARDIAVVDGYAYVGSWNQGLLVLDVSDPAHPKTVAQFEASRAFVEIEAAGGYVYAVGAAGEPSYNWRLFVVDVRDPSKPVSTGLCDLDHEGALAVEGKIAYVGDGWQGVEFIRITNPASPARIGGYDTQGFCRTIAARAGRLYVAASASGLEIVDVSNLAKPVAAGAYVTTNAFDVAVSESHAYVVSGDTGLQVVDVSDPCVPRWVGSLDLGYAACICLGSECAWVGDGAQFTAIDISNPLEPKVVSACGTDGSIYDIDAQGSYAYAAVGGGLIVFDVSNPYRPVIAGQCVLSSLVRGVCVSGPYAYVAGVDGLDIVDVSNPAAPSPMGRYAEQGDWPMDVALHGDYAYLAHGNPGLRVIDVSDPWLPGRVREFDTYFANSFVVRGRYGYLADLLYGLRVFDVSNPATLASLGGYANAGFNKVAVSGNLIYTADYGAGLAILKMDEPKGAEDPGGSGL